MTTTTKRPGWMPTPLEVVTGLGLAAAIFYFVFYDARAYGAEFYSQQRTGRGSFMVMMGEVPAGPTARVIQVPPADDEEATARWSAYCQPREVVDRFGVVRLSYSKAGCEFGRDHD